METNFKTVSFGGYDKKAVDTYIEELETQHAEEIEKYKSSVEKLSETVKSLQTMRELNMNEASGTIDNLREVNEKLQEEVLRMKAELEDYRKRDSESAMRYESISRTLLAARENADALASQTQETCDAKIAETDAYCEKKMSETTEACERMKRETENECERLNRETHTECENLRRVTNDECARLSAETRASCQEMKETTYADCDALKRKTTQETTALREETERNCVLLEAQTKSECDGMKAQTREEVYTTRMTIKKECESISSFISQLMLSVDKVQDACEETRDFANSAFGDLSSQSSEQ